MIPKIICSILCKIKNITIAATITINVEYSRKYVFSLINIINLIFKGVVTKKDITNTHKFSSRLQIRKQNTKISIIAILINPTSILAFMFEEKAPNTEIIIGKTNKTN